jgi:hypothetical protein
LSIKRLLRARIPIRCPLNVIRDTETKLADDGGRVVVAVAIVVAGV